MPQRVFISDCEGQISKNDNAFELAAYFIPEGDLFFRLLSRYDDVLVDIVHRPGYSAGYTLKLIAPFLKAYGATNRSVAEYSRKNMLLIRDAKASLERIQHILPAYIASTSYSPYIEALCTALDFPKEHTFSTHLDLDASSLSIDETQRLQLLRQEILTYPSIEIPYLAKELGDLSLSSRRTAAKLDSIFWEELPKTKAGRIIRGICPVGGTEKARAVADITEALGISMDDVFYVGDSITDSEVLRTVKDSRGISVSFNGNQYAVKQAEISVLSGSMHPISALAEVFAKRGRAGVLEAVKRESPDIITESKGRNNSSPEFVPKVSIITSSNLLETTKESIAFRRMVRGEAIAALG